MTNPMQPSTPAPAPPPVTPQVPSADPAGYAQVSPHQTGPAWYDIQAPQQDLTALVQGARQLSGGDEGAPTGAGMSDVASPRQSQSAQLLSGADGVSVTAGWSGGGGDTGWPNAPSVTILQTPDQGQMGTYPQSSTT